MGKKIRVLTVFVVTVFALGWLTVMLPENSVNVNAAGTYNANAALEYADAHWDDGVGLCAHFVSECLQAGGINSSWSPRTTVLVSQLKKWKEGTFNKLKTSGNRISLYDNVGKVDAGDPLFWYCSNCKLYMHTALCNGASVNGNLLNYAHNNPKDGYTEVYVGNCYECGEPYAAMYAMHMNSSSAVSPATLSVDQKYYKENETVKIKWTAVTGAKNYKLIIWNGDKLIFNQSVGNVTSYDFTAPKGYFTVFVRSDSGKGLATSNMCNFYAGYVETPVIGEVDEYYRENTPVAVSWNECAGANEYVVTVNKDGKDILTKSVGTATSYTVNPGAGKYVISVEARSGIAEMEASKSTCTFKAIGKPDKPVLKYEFDKISKNSVFTWAASAGAEYYNLNIYQGDSAEVYKSLDKITDTTCSVSLPQGDYSACLTAINSTFDDLFTIGDRISFIVYPNAKSISLNTVSITLSGGNSQTLKATVEPEFTSDYVKWTSSNEKVATVDADGKVTPVGAGLVEIKATAGSVSATCTVEVIPNFSLTTLGASIRIVDPYGIRYGIKLLKNEAYKNVDIVEYGTLIIPSATLGDNELNLNTKDVRKVKANNIYSEDSSQVTFTGVLINIPNSFLDTDVKGRGYLIYRDAQGNQKVVYSAVAEKSFNSVAQTAYDLYTGKSEQTEEQKKIISKLEAILNINRNDMNEEATAMAPTTDPVTSSSITSAAA